MGRNQQHKYLITLEEGRRRQINNKTDDSVRVRSNACTECAGEMASVDIPSAKRKIRNEAHRDGVETGNT
jgi:hypothetical protein